MLAVQLLSQLGVIMFTNSPECDGGSATVDWLKPTGADEPVWMQWTQLSDSWQWIRPKSIACVFIIIIIYQHLKE